MTPQEVHEAMQNAPHDGQPYRMARAALAAVADACAREADAVANDPTLPVSALASGIIAGAERAARRIRAAARATPEGPLPAVKETER